LTGLYFRFDTRDRGSPVIIGGEDHKTGQEEENESRYKRLKKTLEKTFPTTKLNHRWSGQLLGTVDGLPYIGQVAEYQFLATGFSGNGMTLGTFSAMLIRDLITENPVHGSSFSRLIGSLFREPWIIFSRTKIFLPIS